MGGVNSLPDFRIDPNPVSDNLIISFTGSDYRKVVIHLYDVQGKELLRDEAVFSIDQASYSIRMQEVPCGFYLIMLQTENDRKMKKVIVAR